MIIIIGLTTREERHVIGSGDEGLEMNGKRGRGRGEKNRREEKRR